MSTFGRNFTGGRLKFLDPHQYSDYDDGLSHGGCKTQPPPSLVVEPRQGRVAIFSSGYENTHQVEQVLSGKRFVLSFWFTCNKQREFEIFLDGGAHVAFGQKFKEAMIQKSNNQRKQAAQNKRKRDL